MPDALLRCPKCGGEMPSRVRNGVQIEQCLECHGIFLDRGEFERLTAAEASFLAAPGEGAARDEDGAPEGEHEDSAAWHRSHDFVFLG